MSGHDLRTQVVNYVMEPTCLVEENNETEHMKRVGGLIDSFLIFHGGLRCRLVVLVSLGMCLAMRLGIFPVPN